MQKRKYWFYILLLFVGLFLAISFLLHNKAVSTIVMNNTRQYVCDENYILPINATWEFRAACPGMIYNIIPSYIHQSWKNNEFNRWSESWKKINPEATYKLWSETEIEAFIKIYYPNFWEHYRLLTRSVIKFDIFRIMALNTFGGVWADIDTVAYHPISNWTAEHEGVRMVVGIEVDDTRDAWSQWYARSLQVCQWTFASVPHHPVLESMLRAIDVALRSVPRTDDGMIDVLDGLTDLAGPGRFTDEIFQEMQRQGHGWWRNFRNLKESIQVGDILLLPREKFARIDKKYTPEVWVLHMFLGSWKDWK